jgi:hypothetical protein
LGRLEIIADDLDALSEASRAHFFLSRVEKRYLLAVKMFDMLFDSGENAAVAWHNYNLRPLKINYKGGFSRLPDGYAAGPARLRRQRRPKPPINVPPFSHRAIGAKDQQARDERQCRPVCRKVQCLDAQGTGTPSPVSLSLAFQSSRQTLTSGPTAIPIDIFAHAARTGSRFQVIAPGVGAAPQ